MLNQVYLRNRRLRVFGGPNGSGKSTILEQIDSKFDIGHYINADEIEKQLKSTQLINLKDFGIQDFDLNKFIKASQNHSIIKKAKGDGYKIDLYFENNTIFNPDKISHSYEAAFLADILRTELLELGEKFAYETVMSHKSKIEFFKASQKRDIKTIYIISQRNRRLSILKGLIKE